MKRFTLGVLLLILAAVAVQAQTPAAGGAARPPVTAAPAASAAAQATPPKPGTKIGVMIFQDALLDSDAGKAAVAAIEKVLLPQKTALEKLSQEMQELQTKLQNAKTDAERAQLDKDIKDKGVQGTRTQEDAQRISNDLQAMHLQPVYALVNKMVDEYAMAHDLAIVVDPSTDNSNIVFASKISDITNEIIRSMNAAYAKDPKITAPSAAAAPPAAAGAAAPKKP